MSNPSITDLLIATLGSGRNVKSFRAILREREFKRYKETSVRVELSRLRKRGYLNNWSITEKGRSHNKNIFLLSYISSPFKENTSATQIVSFDIPETRRKLRTWLRNQIKIFGYKMLHQSLWLGPGPLPKSFIKRLENLKIRKNVRIFAITKKNS